MSSTPGHCGGFTIGLKQGGFVSASINHDATISIRIKWDESGGTKHITKGELDDIATKLRDLHDKLAEA